MSSSRSSADYESKDFGASRKASLTEMASEKVDHAINSAEQAVRRVTDQAEEATERVQAVAGNMRNAIDKSLSDQPMTTLVLAAAVGFVLGALWKS